MRDILGGIVFLTIASLFFFGSNLIPDSFLSDEVGATGLPKIYSLLLMFCSLVLIIKGGFVILKEPNFDLPELSQNLVNPVCTLLAGGFFILTVERLGYVISSFILLTILLKLLAQMKLSKAVLYSAIGSAVYSLIFILIFGTNLPLLWNS